MPIGMRTHAATGDARLCPSCAVWFSDTQSPHSARPGGTECRMRHRYFRAVSPTGFHRVHYTEWGSPDSGRTVVCVHGLTRNCRDFDALARFAEGTARVICVDMPGRGDSDWLDDHARYSIATYVEVANTLIARLDVETVDWIGTSMGGLIGMAMAALPGNPIRRMVLNDVGPSIPQAGVERIARYLGSSPRFRSLEDAERHLRDIHASFGPLTDEQWQTLTRHSVRSDGDLWRLHYDPGIADPFRALAGGPIDLWSLWEDVCCPVLLIRGEHSDVLPAEVARRMTTSGPRARLLTVPAVGHAPALLDTAQITPLVDWLLED